MPAPATFYEAHFTGEGFRTLAVYRLFFKAALRHALKVHADYDQEVRDWYEAHPGYQFPHCIHGSSLVTDYDNICGGCEEGSTIIQNALVAARSDFLRFIKRWEWVADAPVDLDHNTRQELTRWAIAAFPQRDEPVCPEVS